jgi:O-antigen/teichoic acid export membrane protein
MMPTSSVHSATFPRFFIKGALGIKNTKPYGIKILFWTLPLALFLAGMMFLSAPLITHIVGYTFQQSVPALRWLCLLPVFRCFHLSAGNALTGADRQGLRLCAQLFGALFNLGINFWLIPRDGWLGAAWSSLATDGLLAVINWITLLTLNWNSPKCTTLHAESL